MKEQFVIRCLYLLSFSLVKCLKFIVDSIDVRVQNVDNIINSYFYIKNKVVGVYCTVLYEWQCIKR